MRAIAHALPVTSNATPIARIEALPEQLQRLGPRRDPTGRPQPTLRDNRDLTEVAVNVQRYRPHLSSLPLSKHAGEPVGKTTSTDPRSQRNRASRRGGH
jgi:hypothetical protein